LIRLLRAAYHAVGKLLKGKTMRYGGLGGLIVLIADVWAIVNIFQSGASTADKVLWTVIVIVLPILGFILWFFLGPRTGRA
jgi:succinate dehydrogenase/fumarate reductase cytochrome b subunit